jgi:hypothetical protein
MCVTSLCTRGALDTLSRRRSTAALDDKSELNVSPSDVFLALAVIASLFFGFAACSIFAVPWPKSFAGRLYLFWFNFCGSLVGWGALAILGDRYWPCVSGSCAVQAAFSDFALALVAFAGVTGHIPLATMGLFRGLAAFAAAQLVV